MSCKAFCSSSKEKLCKQRRDEGTVQPCKMFAFLVSCGKSLGISGPNRGCTVLLCLLHSLVALRFGISSIVSLSLSPVHYFAIGIAS